MAPMESSSSSNKDLESSSSSNKDLESSLGSDPHKKKEITPMSKRGAYAAISYMACAVLLILFNKAALSSYRFPCVNVITLLQTIFSCLFLYALRRQKIISFTVDGSSSTIDHYPAIVPWKKVVQAAPLSLLYLLYMLVSMEAVRGVNVPMYTTLRRMTVAFTMIAEYFLSGHRHSLSVIGSVGIIILGTLIAGARDLAFDFYSYAIVFLSNINTALYLAFIARIGKSSGLNTFGLMWCNGIVCAPILLIWTTFSGDLQATIDFPYIMSLGFQVVLLSSCFLAFLLNYSVFLNTALNSALSQTICGNLKDLFTITFGWILFGGLPFDLLNIMGQSLGFIGSILYAVCILKGR